MRSETAEIELAANDQGQRLIAEIERLQVYVLDELDALHGRIAAVFRNYGYKEVEAFDPAEDAAAMLTEVLADED